jgi:hypothetical protein
MCAKNRSWWRKSGWGKLLQERVDVYILSKPLVRENQN